MLLNTFHPRGSPSGGDDPATLKLGCRNPGPERHEWGRYRSDLCFTLSCGLCGITRGNLVPPHETGSKQPHSGAPVTRAGSGRSSTMSGC